MGQIGPVLPKAVLPPDFLPKYLFCGQIYFICSIYLIRILNHWSVSDQIILMIVLVYYCLSSVAWKIMFRTCATRRVWHACKSRIRKYRSFFQKSRSFKSINLSIKGKIWRVGSILFLKCSTRKHLYLFVNYRTTLIYTEN